MCCLEVETDGFNVQQRKSSGERQNIVWGGGDGLLLSGTSNKNGKGLLGSIVLGVLSYIFLVRGKRQNVL